MITKKRIIIGVVALIVLAAVIVTVILLSKSKPYNYDLSEYITIGKYKGLEVEKYDEITVTNSEVQEKIDADLEAAATEKEKKSGTVKEGDMVNIDYEGKVDGETFDGGSAEDASVQAGEQQSYIEGFESGLVGMKVGETKELDLTFPDDYSNNPDLAGKDVVFTVTVNSITENIVPELDEEFVKKNTDYDTVKEYKAGVKEELAKEKEDSAIYEQKSTLWSEVVEATEVKKYPEKELGKAKEDVRNQMDSYASQMGTDVDGLREQMGMTEDEDYNNYIKEQAESTVKNEMVVYYIADKENIELDVDAEEELEKLIEESGFTDETFEAQYNQSISEYIDENADAYEMSLLTEKVLDFIYDEAKQVDKKTDKESEDEKEE